MNTKQLKAVVASTVMGVISPLAMIAPASAADISWGGIGDGSHISPFDPDRVDDFYDAANWIGGTAYPSPSGTDKAIFGVNGLSQIINYNQSSLGSGPNYVGDIEFSGEVTGSSSKSYTIQGEAMTLIGDVMAMMTGSGGDHAVRTSITLADNVTFMTSGVDTLAIGDTDTTLDLNGNDLTLDAAGGTITIAGEIDGAGNINVTGGDVNFLATAGLTYDPTVTIADGEFSVSSTTRGNFVLNGGTLKGSSVLLGTLTMNDGRLAPGESPGCMDFTGFTLTGGEYVVEIWGTDTICTDYDSVNVVGAVSLGSATTLTVPSFPSTYTPAIGDDFAIILNDGADPVTGTFQGLAEGGTITVDGYTLAISYVGGDGNDVVLTVTGVPATAATPTAPDTGIGGLISNPLVSIIAALAAVSGIGALRFAEAKKSRK